MVALVGPEDELVEVAQAAEPVQESNLAEEDRQEGNRQEVPLHRGDHQEALHHKDNHIQALGRQETCVPISDDSTCLPNNLRDQGQEQQS